LGSESVPPSGGAVSARGAAQQEEPQPEDHEDAQERVHLAGSGENEGQHRERDADRVDGEDRLEVGQAEVQQAMVDVAAIGRERGAPLGQTPDDDPERVDDREAG
jgi:hypothetical protein